MQIRKTITELISDYRFHFSLEVIQKKITAGKHALEAQNYQFTDFKVKYESKRIALENEIQKLQQQIEIYQKFQKELSLELIKSSTIEPTIQVKLISSVLHNQCKMPLSWC